MLKFILRRLLIIVPTMLFIVLFVFIILNLTPSNPGRIMLGSTATEEQVAEVNKAFGVDQPVLLQYGQYLLNMVQGDFGVSYKSQQPVFDLLMPKFPTTLLLSVLSVLTSAVIGIPLGVLSAVKQYSFADNATTFIMLIFASIPGFWLGLMAILLFSLQLGWLPSSGVGTWQHYIMPVLTLALPIAAYLSRLTRATMLDCINQDYIRTARSKGASRNRQVFVHALRNAMMPVVTQMGMSFAGLLGGALITEVVFGLPGFGSAILAAIKIKDTPVVMGAVVFLSFVFMVIMLLVDIIYALLDPRSRTAYTK